jgi:hypothetical protein
VPEKYPHQGIAADAYFGEGIGKLVQEVIEAVFTEPCGRLKHGAIGVERGLALQKFAVSIGCEYLLYG